MGLLKMLRKMKASDSEARVVVLGLDNAGKTTILKKLSEEDIDQIQPTQGFNIKSINVAGFKINVWDIGGQKAIRQYWNQYLKNTDVLIYVVDSGDQARLEESGDELDTLLKREELATCPVLVFANKADLMSSCEDDLIVTKLRLANYNSREYMVKRCSAKTGEGLKEGFEWAMQSIVKQGKASYK